MDLTALVKQLGDALDSPKRAEISGFSGSSERKPEKQAIENDTVSGISGQNQQVVVENSDAEQIDNRGDEKSSGGRAREVFFQEPEIPEIPEKGLVSETYFSGSGEAKPEKLETSFLSDAYPSDG
jgi:hypothetical protein